MLSVGKMYSKSVVSVVSILYAFIYIKTVDANAVKLKVNVFAQRLSSKYMETNYIEDNFNTKMINDVDDGKYPLNKYSGKNRQYSDGPMFDKIKELNNCYVPPKCPVYFNPVCAISDGSVQVYGNLCVLKETMRKNPLRRYQEISTECCHLFVKYCTLPQLNIM